MPTSAIASVSQLPPLPEQQQVWWSGKGRRLQIRAAAWHASEAHGAILTTPASNLHIRCRLLYSTVFLPRTLTAELYL